MRPMSNWLVVTITAAIGFSSSVRAQIVVGVLRLDANGAALSAASANTIIDEYRVTPTSATLLTSLNVSQLTTYSNAGNATSEGHVALSGDGQYLVLTGYNTAPGTAGVAATTGTAVQRKVALVDFAGNVTTTLLGTTIGGNPRSAYSTNGSDIWVATSAAGVNYTSTGSGTATQLATAPTNTRVVNVFSNQLYVSSASSPFIGVNTIGTGTPTTSGQTATNLSGFPATTIGSSNYDYVLVNPTTLVVADDRTTAGGGLEKWVNSSGTWSLSYSALGGASSNVGMRGLTYDPSTTTFYATGSDGNLYSGTDTGTTFTFNQLALGTASGAGDAFRGLDIMPVPEPASMVLAGLAGAGLAARLIRRKKLAKTA